MKVGDKFKKQYPFKLMFSKGDGIFQDEEWWQIGCYQEQDGYEVFNNCNGIGYVEFEVLAIVDMPRKMKQRIIYKFDRTDPDGNVKKSSKTHTVTIDKFKSFISGDYAYPYDFEVVIP